MILVIIGYMGCGKSSVGKRLAVHLGYDFKDLDAQIESEEANTISEIFSTKGEIYFRKKENSTLKDLIKTSENLVIALGGGTPCYGDTMNFLASNTKIISVYIKTPLEVLTTRLYSEKSKRPVIAHIEKKEDLKDFIRKHLFERSFYYNKASKVIDANEDSVETIAEKIVAGLF
jgi:shikimate kinase